jgi:RAB protein geranylgeranyltransferase component A
MATSMFGKGSVYRVPVTPAEALKSSLVGALQKRSLMNFATWLDKYQARDKSGDDKVEGMTPDEFKATVEAYFATHNPDKIKDIPALIETYKGRRLHMVYDLERKYHLPFFPLEFDVVFQAGPLGLRIDGKPFANTGSVKIKSAVRVIGFQNAQDGTPGQGEKSGLVKPGDIISKVGGVSVLGLSNDEVTKTLVAAARPVTVTFMRPAAHENEDPTSTDPTKRDLRNVKMADLYAHFGLDENSQTFIGHAMALHTSDTYIQKPAEPTVEAIQLYGKSVGRYGQNSPYLYPMYGLSTLPEGFSRLAAIHGGIVMLRTSPDEVLIDPETGKVAGVRVGNKAAKCKFVIGDGSYFTPEKSKVTKRVARSICLLKHPIKDTSGGDSAQIILPAKTLKGKQHDIYISCVSSFHSVASQGVYICICSTVAETANPAQELEPAFALLGEIEERFDSVTDVRGPVDLFSNDNQVVCEGLDETSHFESAADDILNVYRRVFGKALDLTEKLVADQPNE